LTEVRGGKQHYKPMPILNDRPTMPHRLAEKNNDMTSKDDSSQVVQPRFAKFTGLDFIIIRRAYMGQIDARKGWLVRKWNLKECQVRTSTERSSIHHFRIICVGMPLNACNIILTHFQTRLYGECQLYFYLLLFYSIDRSSQTKAGLPLKLTTLA